MINWRKSSVWALAACLGMATTAPAAAPKGTDRFPTLADQLRRANAIPGSAFERFIKDNQELELLRADEAAPQKQVVPPWAKVWWKKSHPESKYSPNDPAGGYPHVLKEIVEWMESHQDFVPGLAEDPVPPGFADPFTEESEKEESGRGALVATAGTNRRISGASTARRSESDIRINPWNGNKIISASNNIGGSGWQAQFWSTDGGTTWGQSTLPATSPDTMNSDPTVDWTSDGTAWATSMGIQGNTLRMKLYKSTDSGATWAYDSTISGSQTNTDKQMMWVDHSATSPYKDRMYVIWHNGNPAFMNSKALGGSWGTPTQISAGETTGTGIGADVKTNANGDVFGAYPDTGSRGIYVVKSTNGGTSYSAPVRIATTYRGYDIGVPAFSSRRALVYVSLGAFRNASKNNVYATWTDLSGASGCNTTTSEPGTSVSSTCKTRIWFSRSTDGGSTWAAATKVNDQAGLNDQFNPFVAVDEGSGQLGLIYYDTVADAGRKKTDVYYQASYNDGASWGAAIKVTTGQTDETISGADSGNQYGDYNGLSAAAGAFFPCWTDRRSGASEEIWTSKITEGGAVTYAISGNAGTDAATISAGSTSTTSDASGNYSFSGLAAGTYTLSASKSGCTFSPASQSVTVGPDATGKNFTATCTSGDVQLTSGVGYSDSVAASAWKYYYIVVPAGATNLTFATTGATGDVDIYTQSGGVKPTSSTYVCRPYTASGNESCSATNPVAGTWYVGVNGYAAGSYTITATITTGTVTYSIAGNAGTASATVTAGTASTTADASGNYSITGLAAGTYTVSASKSGCTFSPTSQSVTVGPSATGKSFTATCGGGGQVERLLNGTFESLTASTNTAPDGSWTRSAFTGTSFNTLIAAGTSPHGGTDYAYLGVNNSASQTLDSAATAIPSGATSATLSFYVSIVTSETGTTVYDTLKIQLVDASTNAVLSTLATLSNVNSTGAATTYVLKSYDVTAQKGKSVKVRFLATTDSSLTTSFRLDDVSLKSDG